VGRGPPRGSPVQNVSERRVVLMVAAMASFLTPFMATSVNIALPSIGAEFSVDAVTLSWVTTAYLLAAAMLLVPMGRLADIRGRKKVFLAGMVGYTLVSALCTLSVSEHMLIVLRALQGFSDAMMFGTSTAIVTSVYPPEQRGRALGITVAAVYSGGSLGPFVGGFLTQLAGWRSIFWLTTLLGALVVAMTLWKMRGEWADARGQKMDVVGSLLYSAALLGVMFGFRVSCRPQTARGCSSRAPRRSAGSSCGKAGSASPCSSSACSGATPSSPSRACPRWSTTPQPTRSRSCSACTCST